MGRSREPHKQSVGTKNKASTRTQPMPKSVASAASAAKSARASRRHRTGGDEALEELNQPEETGVETGDEPMITDTVQEDGQEDGQVGGESGGDDEALEELNHPEETGVETGAEPMITDTVQEDGQAGGKSGGGDSEKATEVFQFAGYKQMPMVKNVKSIEDAAAKADAQAANRLATANNKQMKTQLRAAMILSRTAGSKVLDPKSGIVKHRMIPVKDANNKIKKNAAGKAIKTQGEEIVSNGAHRFICKEGSGAPARIGDLIQFCPLGLVDRDLFPDKITGKHFLCMAHPNYLVTSANYTNFKGAAMTFTKVQKIAIAGMVVRMTVTLLKKAIGIVVKARGKGSGGGMSIKVQPSDVLLAAQKLIKHSRFGATMMTNDILALPAMTKAEYQSRLAASKAREA